MEGVKSGSIPRLSNDLELRFQVDGGPGRAFLPTSHTSSIWQSSGFVIRRIRVRSPGVALILVSISVSTIYCGMRQFICKIFGHRWMHPKSMSVCKVCGKEFVKNPDGIHKS